MTRYWASCEKFTVGVVVDADGRIVATAPIVSKFIGQRWENLRRWMEGLGGFSVVKLDFKVPPLVPDRK